MWFKGISLSLLGLGVFVLMQVLMPIVAFQGWQLTSFNQDSLLASPHQNSLITSQVLGVSIENIDIFPRLISNGNSIAPYGEFSLTIPSINLSATKVKVNSNDFEETLAQLPGTALPGEKGNVFISGHSSISTVLHQKAVFANLVKVKKGDQVQISVLGQQFEYQVMGLKIVEPDDISVVYPPSEDGRYLTLMTCVPPGFNTKRLIVLAKLK